MIKIKCKHCGQAYEIEDSMINEKLECACGAKFSFITPSSKPLTGLDRVEEALDSLEVQCPFCRGNILSGVQKCRHCGAWLKPPCTFLKFVAFLLLFNGCGWVAQLISLLVISSMRQSARYRTLYSEDYIYGHAFWAVIAGAFSICLYWQLYNSLKKKNTDIKEYIYRRRIFLFIVCFAYIFARIYHAWHFMFRDV